MKNILIYILTVSFLTINHLYSQRALPQYEQIAFEYFLNEIYEINQIDKKVSVSKDLKPIMNLAQINLSLSHNNGLFRNPNWWPICNQKFIKEFKKVAREKDFNAFANNLSGFQELDLIDLDKNTFKVKEYGKGKFPKLIVDQSFTLVESKMTIVNINLLERKKEIIYHIQIDETGEVIEWCKTNIEKNTL